MLSNDVINNMTDEDFFNYITLLKNSSIGIPLPKEEAECIIENYERRSRNLYSTNSNEDSSNMFQMSLDNISKMSADKKLEFLEYVNHCVKDQGVSLNDFTFIKEIFVENSMAYQNRRQLIETQESANLARLEMYRQQDEVMDTFMKSVVNLASALKNNLTEMNTNLEDIKIRSVIDDDTIFLPNGKTARITKNDNNDPKKGA